MFKDLIYNMKEYARFILRRDRLYIPIWLLSLTLLTVIVAMAYTQLVPTEMDRFVMAQTMANPAVTAMFGPGWGLNDYHFGAIMGHQMLLFTALIVAVMAILLTAKHTRGDEENGRIELIGSLPVGRLSSLSATLLIITGVSLLVALLNGLGLSLLGIEGVDLHGSLLYGAALGVTGIFFGAVTAFSAQLFDNTQGTLGFSFGFLGLSYLLRAIGDIEYEILSWLSPLGWIVRTQVYVNNYWGPLLLTLGVATAILAFALYLNSIRDLGAGFFPAKPGRKVASPCLQSPLGLAFRLQKGMMIGWALTLFILGASYGSVLGDLESYLESMDLIREMLIDVEGFSLIEQFLPMLMAVISMVAAIPVLLMVLRLGVEENKNRIEHLLARSVSRTSIMGSYLFLSLMISLFMLFLAVLGMWSAGVGLLDDPISFSTIFNAGMTYLPALWVMSSIAVLFIGLFPQRAVFVWLYLGYSFFVVYLGGMLQLPQWMANLSPFGHIPKLPVEETDFFIYTVLTIIALILMFMGLRGYKERDIGG